MATFDAGSIEATLTLDRSPFQKGLKAAQAQATAFARRKYTAKLDVDTAAAQRKLDAVKAQLDALARSSPSADVDADTAAAAAKLAAIQAQLDKLDHERATPSVDLASLSTLEERLTRLSISLDRLDVKHAEPRVDVDTAEADAQVVTLQSLLDRLDRTRVTPRIDTSGFTNMSLAMQLVVAGAVALAPALVPVLVSATGAALGLGAALSTVGAGLPVLLLGFSGIGKAVQALGQQQTTAARTAVTLASSQNQVRSAVQALANARQNAADQAIAAAERVRNAEQSLRQAEADEEAAVRSLSQARVEARQHLQDLAFATADADLALRSANLQVKQAKANLDALNKSTGDASHAQALLVEAQTAYQNLLANPQATEQQRAAAAAAIVSAERQVQAAQAGTSATALQREQTQLAYDEAVQRQKEAVVAARRAAAENADAQRKGIANSDAVVAAQNRIADAQRRVQQAQQEVADARRAQAREQQQAAQQIANAEQAVADAQRKVAQSSAGAAGGLSAVQQAMRGLSPQAQQFARFLYSLKGQLDKLRDAAQAGLLPGVEKGLRALLPLMPDLILFIRTTGKAFGDLFAQAGKALNAPFWHGFIRFLAATAGPNITLFGEILGNLAKAAAALIVAFEPLGHEFLQWLVEATAKFAIWAASLAGSKGFKDFVAYVRKEGPRVAALLLAFGDAVYQLGVALAPYADRILKFLTGLFNTLADFFSKHKGRADLAGIVKMLTDLAAVIAGGLVQAINDAARNVDWEVIGRIFGNFVKRLAVIFSHLDWGAILAGAGEFLIGVIAAWWGDTVAEGFRQSMRNLASGIKWLFTPPLWIIGKAIVEGIRDGINHWWGIFIPGAQFIRLIEDVKRLLGIHSPSTVFFDIGADVVRGFVNGLLSLLGSVQSAAASIAATVTDGIVPSLSTLQRWLTSTLPGGEDVLAAHTKSSFTSVAATTSTRVHNGVLPPLRAWNDYMRDTIPKSLSAMSGANTSGWQSIARNTASGENQTATQLQQMRHALSQTASAFSGLASTAQRAWTNIKNSARDPVRFLINVVYNQGIAKAFNSMAAAVGLDKSKRLDPVVPPSQLATGGYVRGPGGPRDDRVPAMLSDGEFVVNAAATRRNLGLLKALNGPQGQGYKDGGLVGAAGVAQQIQPALHMPAFAYGHLQSIWDRATKGLASLITGGGMVGEIARQATRNMQAAGAQFWHGYDTVGSGNTFLEILKSVIGTPYLWGGTTTRGFDCSGLIWWALGKLGIKAPRTSAEQYKWVKHISPAAGVPGDLLFWDKGNIHHVAANLGGGRMIDAPHTGAKVRIEQIWPHALWGRIPGLAGKIIGAAGDVAKFVGRGVARGQGLAWALAHGITGDRWHALDYVISHESSWNPNAQNPRSSAWGLGQLIAANRSKYHYDTTVPKQLAGTVAYMQDRYGGIIPAANFWRRHHFYDTGGLADGPGALFKGPGKERVLSTRQTAAFEELIPHLTRLADAFASGQLERGGFHVHVEQHAAPGLSSTQDLERLMRKVETRIRAGRRS